MQIVKHILLIITLLSSSIMLSAQERDKQESLKAIGNITKWKTLNYILFSTTSASNNFQQRSFLIDKSTGKARLEAITTNNTSLVLLFNYKSKLISKCYVNGELTNIESSKIPFQEVLNQLFDDTELLFLPMYVIALPKSQITVDPNKLVNAEKLIEVTFRNATNLNSERISGSIYLTNKGVLKEYTINQDRINVSNIKDIGDGILTPTTFDYIDDTKPTIKFNTVAAFTDVELDKFSNL